MPNEAATLLLQSPGAAIAALPREAVLDVQRHAGNRAFSGLVRSVQRGGGEGDEQDLETSSMHQLVRQGIGRQVVSIKLPPVKVKECLVSGKIEAGQLLGVPKAPPGEVVKVGSVGASHSIETEIGGKGKKGDDGQKQWQNVLEAKVKVGIKESILQLAPVRHRNFWLVVSFDAESPEFKQSFGKLNEDAPALDVTALKFTAKVLGQFHIPKVGASWDIAGKVELAADPTDALKSTKFLRKHIGKAVRYGGRIAKAGAAVALSGIARTYFEHMAAWYEKEGLTKKARQARHAARVFGRRRATKAIERALRKPGQAYRWLSSYAAKHGVSRLMRNALRWVPILNIAMTVWDVAEIAYALHKGLGPGGGGSGSGGAGGSGGKHAPGATGPGGGAETGSSSPTDAGKTASGAGGKTGAASGGAGGGAGKDRSGVRLPDWMKPAGELPDSWDEQLVARLLIDARVNDAFDELTVVLDADAAAGDLTRAVGLLTHPTLQVMVPTAERKYFFGAGAREGAATIRLSRVRSEGTQDEPTARPGVAAGVALSETPDRFLDIISPYDLVFYDDRERQMRWDHQAKRAIVGKPVMRSDGVSGRIRGVTLGQQAVHEAGGKKGRSRQFWLTFDIAVDVMPSGTMAMKETHRFFLDPKKDELRPILDMSALRDELAASVEPKDGAWVVKDEAQGRTLQFSFLPRAELLAVGDARQLSETKWRMQFFVNVVEAGQEPAIIDDAGIRRAIAPGTLELLLDVTPSKRALAGAGAP